MNVFRNSLGLEYNLFCYEGCCTEGCCSSESYDNHGESSSSSTGNPGLVAGICVIVFFLILLFILVGSQLLIRDEWQTFRDFVLRARRRVTMPQRRVLVTNSDVTRAGAPVPQHHGYDQPDYQPSTMSSPAQFVPPSPCLEQVSEDKV